MNEQTYTATDDFELLQDAIANVPGARAALQTRVDELPADRAEFIRAYFAEAVAA